MTAVEVCPICDIAGCRHIRERKAQMTHPTDEELDAMVRELMSRPYRRGSESSDEAAMRRQNEREQAAAALTALRAQLAAETTRADRAEAEISRLTDLNSTAYIDGHDAAKNEYRDEIQRLEVLNAQLTVMVGEDAVEQIEAERAAQIEADAGVCDQMASSCDDAMEIASGEALEIKIVVASFKRMAMRCASAIRAQPHDRTALDAVIRAAKVEALKEAADLPKRTEKLGGQNYAYVRVEEILALIEREGV